MTNLKKAAAILTMCFFACHFLAIRPPVADVDRTGAVDLVDAIMAVQGLHHLSHVLTGEEPGVQSDLGIYLINAVDAFKVLAGVKSFTPVKPAKTLSPGASFLALLPTLSVNYELPMTLFSKTVDTIYQSIAPEPSTPPPESTFFMAS